MPEESREGVLAGLRARTGVVVLVRVVRGVELVVEGGGIEPPARIGETVAAAAAAELTVRVRVDARRKDYKGRPSRIELVELLSDESGEAGVIAYWLRPDGGAELVHRFGPIADRSGGHGFTVRARGRNDRGYWFYTSAVRVLPQ